MQKPHFLDRNMPNERLNASRGELIDADQLDRQFISLVGARIDRLQFKFLKRFAPEIKFLFRVHMWFKKQYLSNSSIGFDIFNLRLSDSSGGNLNLLQKCSFLITPIGDYFKERLSSGIQTLDTNTSLLLEKMFAFFDLLQVLHTFIFIRDGEYRTILLRLFSIKTLSTGKFSPSFSASTTFLNRQLLWHSLSEVLTMLLPFLLNIHWLQAAIRILTSKRVDAAKLNLEPYFCQLCREPANNATCFAECSHLYCQFCITNYLKEHGSFECKFCNASVETSRQLFDNYQFHK